MKWFVLWAALTTAGAAAETNQHWSVLQRLEREHLAAVHADRLRIAGTRQEISNQGVYQDFRGVVHVHAEDAEHTKGTRKELLAGALKAGVQVVLMTEHRGPKEDAWRGMHEGVLFIAGSEVGDGSLRFPDYGPDGKPLPEGGLRFLSHVEERYDAPMDGFVGMEIANRHTDAILDKGQYLYLMAAANDPERWRRVTTDFKDFPDEMFAAGVDYRTGILEKWDRETKHAPCTGVGANDAHQNQIFQGVTFDPYEVSLRNLCTHILVRELSEPEIRQALKEGHVYVSYDWLCDPTGFAFGAVNNLGVFPMGDPAAFLGTTRVMGITPAPAKLKLFHEGTVVQETTGTNLTFEARESGAYRLEAWLTVDGEDRPWIFSNPVFLKTPTAGEMQIPSMAISDSVEAHRNLTYVEGEADSAEKHKLDIYSPKDPQKAAPVLFFVHGGAWRFGDRTQYPPLGNRYAKEGLVTVIPSYRLAPKYPFPAQIEDVVSAFAWTVKHVAEYGGDSNQIFVAGHSAGGHLVALLALDQDRLQRAQIPPQAIRGVLAWSGVYDLASGDGVQSVFGTDVEARRQASPVYHIRSGAPPFLITYCQWDYFTLPAQARELDAALIKAAVPASLLFVPRESHISEMLSVTKDKDLTVLSALDFVKNHLRN